MKPFEPPILPVTDELLAADAMINEGGALRQPHQGDPLFHSRTRQTVPLSEQPLKLILLSFGVGAFLGWLFARD